MSTNGEASDFNTGANAKDVNVVVDFGRTTNFIRTSLVGSREGNARVAELAFIVGTEADDVLIVAVGISVTVESRARRPRVGTGIRGQRSAELEAGETRREVCDLGRIRSGVVVPVGASAHAFVAEAAEECQVTTEATNRSAEALMGVLRADSHTVRGVILIAKLQTTP